MRHHVRGRDRHIEAGPTLFDFLRQIVAADEVGPGSLGVASVLALSEDGDRHIFAESMRQGQGPAQLLLGVADVDSEQHVHLNRLVEFGAGRLLHQADRLCRRIGAVTLDLAMLLAVALAVRHRAPI